jgi:hypothetical protein
LLLKETLQIITGTTANAAVFAENTAPNWLVSTTNVKQSFVVGGTSSFTTYAAPLTNTEKMPYINSL